MVIYSKHNLSKGNERSSVQDRLCSPKVHNLRHVPLIISVRVYAGVRMALTMMYWMCATASEHPQ